MAKKRFKAIDILKVLGLLGIILAHVNPPPFFVQLRSFDVILLVAISVYLYFLSQKDEKYRTYVWKRIKRLVFPTYLFLGIFFICAFLVKPYPFSVRQIVDSFLLHGGIGYVWIVRIYLIVALLLPLMKRCVKKISKNWVLLFFSSLLMVIQEILFGLGITKSGFFWNEIVGYVIPCLAIIFLICWVRSSSTKKVFTLTCFLTLLFVVISIYYGVETGQYVPTHTTKYPFRTYYISYALAVSGWLMLLFKKKKVTNTVWNRWIEFVSMHSFWIYLWHIPFIFLLDKFCPEIFWLIKFTMVFIGAFLIVLIQSKVVGIIEKKYGSNDFTKVWYG